MFLVSLVGLLAVATIPNDIVSDDKKTSSSVIGGNTEEPPSSSDNVQTPSAFVSFKPKSVKEIFEHMSDYIKKTYSDTNHKLIAQDINGKLCAYASEIQSEMVRIETDLGKDLDQAQDTIQKLRVKLSLRNEVDNLLEKLSPVWLRGLHLRRKYMWRIIFQLEYEPTELLKKIIVNQMEIQLDQFCDDMDEFVEQSARNIHLDSFPNFQSETKMQEVLESLGYTRGTVAKSLIALVFHFRKQENTFCFMNDHKYYFLYFSKLKEQTSHHDIADFLNIYFKKIVVYPQNITMMGDETGEDGSRPNEPPQAFVRIEKIVTDRVKVVDIDDTIPILRKIVEEIKILKSKSSNEQTIEDLQRKKQFITQYCDDVAEFYP